MRRIILNVCLKIVIFPIWAALTILGILCSFLTGISTVIGYLIAVIALITAGLTAGFGLTSSTGWEIKMMLLTAVVFLLLPHIGAWICAGVEILKALCHVGTKC